MNGWRGLVAGTVLLLPGVVQAQGVRGTAHSMARYFEVRPFVRDTIAFASVEQLPDGTFRYEGLPISCVPQLECVRYVSGARQHAVVFTQDVAFTAWGLGIEGLSATVQVRARGDLGGTFDWPRSNDAFDAIQAYAELLKGDFRFRAGRMQSTSGLGFTSYDGGHIQYAPLRRLRLEAFGGRSLARGVYEPRHEALDGVEDFFPDRDALLFGGGVTVEPWTHTSIGARYQRELWSNRSALVSERAAVDLQSAAFAPVHISAGADYDFAFGRIGKANVTARLPLSDGAVVLEGVGSRYVPYFELWTIWGYFSPVAHHQAEARVAWRPWPGLQLRGGAGYRKYDDAEAPVIFDPLPDDAVFISAAAAWSALPRLTIDASYRLERGFGAYLGSGDASARLDIHERVRATLDISAFQQIEEFRLGDGTVLGGGGSLDVDVTHFASLSAGAHVYRQNWDNRAGDADWNQVRGWAALRVAFGRDPGMNRQERR